LCVLCRVTVRLAGVHRSLPAQLTCIAIFALVKQISIIETV
jgi:hypothetical protein